MSQENKDKSEAAELSTKSDRRLHPVGQSCSQGKFTPEDKIHIVLEGFCLEVSVSDLCSREGI